jgi:hypothetical protein
MTTFKTHTIESAPAGSKAILEGARKQLGFVPNLYANLAEAPAALDGYTTLSGIFDRTSLTPVERHFEPSMQDDAPPVSVNLVGDDSIVVD